MAPIRIHRTSPSPDVEAEFAARSDFNQIVTDFLQGIADNYHPHTQEEDPSNSLHSLPPDGHQISNQREARNWSNVPREGTNEATENSDCTGSPFTAVDSSDNLSPRQSETHTDIRPETTPSNDSRPGTNHIQAGTQPQNLNRPQKRKHPHSTEEQEVLTHNERLEKERCVSRRKRKCRRFFRRPLPQHTLTRPPSPLSTPYPLRPDSPTAEEGEQSHAKEGCSLKKPKPRSRHKKQCRFGPRKQGRNKYPQDAEELHPSPTRSVEHREEVQTSTPVDCRV